MRDLVDCLAVDRSALYTGCMGFVRCCARFALVFVLVSRTAFAVCGDGHLDAGEQCDDGNVVDGDCCSSTCQFEPLGSPCDDHNACTTTDTCDGNGKCVGSAPLHCDDNDKCTVDSCSPVDGCHNDQVDFAITRAEVGMSLSVDACAGQKIPASITKRFAKARQLLARANRTFAVGRQRTLVKSAASQLSRANGAEEKLGNRVSAACGTQLQNRVRTARSRTGCLYSSL